MNRPVRRALFPWVMLMVLCAAPSLAQAGKKVVVLAFEGKDHEAIRTGVEKMLGQDHKVVPHDKLVMESKKLGIGLECNETNIMGAASIFGAEGVVCGKIKKRRLVILVYNGGDGKLIKKFRVKKGKRGLSGGAVTKLRRLGNAALAKTWNWDSVSKKEPAKPEPAPEKKPEGGELAKAIERTPPEAARTTPEPEPEDDPGSVVAAMGDDEDPLAKQATHKKTRAATVRKKTKSSPSRLEGRHAVRLSVGGALMIKRNYKFYEVDAGVYGADKLAKGWQPGPVGGLAIDAEIFPGAWLARPSSLVECIIRSSCMGIGANFGIGVSYSRYFGISWRMEGDPEAHSATHQRLAVDARVRYMIIDKPLQLMVFVKFGYQFTEFSMNDETKPAMFADVAFSSLDVGGGLEISVMPRWLHASSWFHYLPVLSRGEISETSEWGAAGGGGWRTGGALRGKLWGPIGWRFEFEYTSYLASFKWLPEETSQPNTKAGKADKARDRYMTSLLFLSFVN